jgi:hypothetical protein
MVHAQPPFLQSPLSRLDRLFHYSSTSTFAVLSFAFCQLVITGLAASLTYCAASELVRPLTASHARNTTTASELIRPLTASHARNTTTANAPLKTQLLNFANLITSNLCYLKMILAAGSLLLWGYSWTRTI